jgi:hypothetical protein
MECNCGATMNDKRMVRNGFTVTEYKECSGCGRTLIEHDIASNWARGFLNNCNDFEPSDNTSKCMFCDSETDLTQYWVDWAKAALYCTSNEDYLARTSKVDSDLVWNHTAMCPENNIDENGMYKQNVEPQTELNL